MGLCCSAEQRQGDLFTDELSLPSRPRTEPRTRANPTLEEIDNTGGKAATQLNAAQAGHTQHELTFARRLEVSAVPVLLLLATGLGIECDLTFETAKRALVLRHEMNRRELHFTDVQSALSDKSEMSKIQTQAGVAQDANCCAVLMRDRKCLTLRFDTPTETKSFVSLVNDYMSSK